MIDNLVNYLKQFFVVEEAKKKPEPKLELTLNRYQKEATKTAIYPGQGTFQGLIYTSLGLGGEAGETLNKVKKILRDCNGVLTENKKKAIVGEIRGCLWYVAACATELGVDLGDIAQDNLNELSSRQERNVLTGDGDNR